MHKRYQFLVSENIMMIIYHKNIEVKKNKINLPVSILLNYNWNPITYDSYICIIGMNYIITTHFPQKKVWNPQNSKDIHKMWVTCGYLVEKM